MTEAEEVLQDMVTRSEKRIRQLRARDASFRRGIADTAIRMEIECEFAQVLDWRRTNPPDDTAIG